MNTRSQGGSLARRSQRPGRRSLRVNGYVFVTKTSHIVIKEFGCGQHKQIDNRPNETIIPDRSQSGLTMAAPTAGHWGIGDKYATGVAKVKKIRRRDNIFIETWNVRTPSSAGKFEILTHERDRYH